MPANEIEKVETLARNMARGKGRNQWVTQNNGTFKVSDAPVLSGLAQEALKVWLPKIGVSFEAEFDTTGKRIA